MSHFREQTDRRRVESELRLVQDHGRRKIGPQQQGGQADEAQGSVAGLVSQERPVQPALPPAQPDPPRGIRHQHEVVEERGDMTYG